MSSFSITSFSLFLSVFIILAASFWASYWSKIKNKWLEIEIILMINIDLILIKLH